MGAGNREIEWKLLSVGCQTMAEVDRAVKSALEANGLTYCRPPIEGCAADTYWNPPEDSKADFARVRENTNEETGLNAQMSLKASDRGSNENRVEIDLGVSDAAQAIAFMTYWQGDPLGRVTKRYTVYFLENHHTTVSVYKVLRDKRVFVEVEATSLKRVRELTNMLRRKGLALTLVKTSLFEMFVLKKPMVTENLSPVLDEGKD